MTDLYKLTEIKLFHNKPSTYVQAVCLPYNIFLPLTPFSTPHAAFVSIHVFP